MKSRVSVFKVCITKILTFFIAASSLFTILPSTVYAKETGNLYIRAEYSDGINPYDNDVITIVFKDAAGNKKNVTFNLSEYIQNYYKLTLESGTYTVDSFEYQGDNSLIEESGYAIQGKFEVKKSEDKYITVGLGKNAALTMQGAYDSVLIRIQGQYTNDLERTLLEISETDETTIKETSANVTEAATETASVETSTETSAEPTENRSESSISETESPAAKNTLSEGEEPVVEDFRKESSEEKSPATIMFWNTLPLIVLSIAFAVVVIILRKMGKL